MVQEGLVLKLTIYLKRCIKDVSTGLSGRGIRSDPLLLKRERGPVLTNMQIEWYNDGSQEPFRFSSCSFPYCRLKVEGRDP